MPRVVLSLCFAVLAALSPAAPSMAQFLDNSTVFDAPLQQLLQQDQMLAHQMRMTEQQVVQRTMNDPRAQTMYRQHRMQGGQMPFADFAYLYAATGGFSPAGIQHFSQTSQDIARQQQLAYLGLRQAQDERAAALGEHAAGFHADNAEFGNLVQGNSTYLHPGTGQPIVLPHIRPGVVHRDQAGQLYRMDDLGTYYVRAPDGLWYPMQPR